MKYKFWIKFFLFGGGIFLINLGEAVAPKNKVPPSIPQEDFADPFGGDEFNLNDLSGGEGPPQIPMDDERGPLRQEQKDSSYGKLSMNRDFVDDFGALPPEEDPGKFPPLQDQKAPPEEPPAPALAEAPAPFSWNSIDLHNLAQKTGRKSDMYRA